MMLRLLGSPALETKTGVTDLPVSRSAWLLFYLAATGDWVRRDDLSFFLRPDADVKTGHQYLRRLLSGAKKLAWAEGLESDFDRLRWNVDTDVERFRRAAREGRWFEAVGLYRGPFLQGLDASYLPSYESWLEGEREDLEHIWHNCTLHYAADLESAGQHRDAVQTAEGLLKHNALDEEVLRLYVRNAYLSGQHKRALDAAATFRQELQEELGMEPAQGTQELIEKVRSTEPLEKRVTPHRYGRRRDDVVAASPEERRLSELLKLLHTPDSRLVTLGNAGDGHATVMIVKRVPQAHLALAATLELAERLVNAQHHSRALELLMLVRNHPECDAAVRERVEALWEALEAHLKRPRR